MIDQENPSSDILTTRLEPEVGHLIRDVFKTIFLYSLRRCGALHSECGKEGRGPHAAWRCLKHGNQSWQSERDSPWLSKSPFLSPTRAPAGFKTILSHLRQFLVKFDFIKDFPELRINFCSCWARCHPNSLLDRLCKMFWVLFFVFFPPFLSLGNPFRNAELSCLIFPISRITFLHWWVWPVLGTCHVLRVPGTETGTEWWYARLLPVLRSLRAYGLWLVLHRNCNSPPTFL